MLRQLVGNFLRKRFVYAHDTILAQAHGGDLDRFRNLSTQFQDIYRQFAESDCSPYILDTWQKFNDRFVTLSQPALPDDFLNHPIVLDTLTANPVKPIWKPFLAEVESFFGKAAAKKILQETVIGNPRICDLEYLTSPGRIMHGWMLYAYLRYHETRCGSAPNFQTIVEYGGGYGGLAHIWSQYSATPLTYVILDTPIMCTIQWQYLYALEGEDKVVPIFSRDQPIVPGRINILPVSMITREDLAADLFVSTWALSESNSVAQQAVADANWFGAQHLLLAFQRSSGTFPYAEMLEGAVAQRGGVIREMPFAFVNNFTAFA